MAAGYKVIGKAKFGKREEYLLVRLDNGAPGPYDMNAPGLYPDETVVEVAGEPVAVSVEPFLSVNSGSLALHGYCRWLEEDGSTRCAPDGTPVETSISTNFPTEWLKLHDQDDLATELVRVMLGEDPTKVPIKNTAPQTPLVAGYPEGHHVDHEATHRDMLMLHQEIIANGNIRDAIVKAKKMVNLKLAL